ncbi:TonB-dependent receptor [Flavobacteriaceae bacterium TP-CH-4]|uniref:TonB-dependent receptor n=1 Tax=Pelagihabitans pacificus TaxID=2696054 RepID=A0A967ASB7_9FLAO|nr:TonB-dependent receptor plug domain-containing protein [Pelagihabitans pacificus]NHF59378.1 TonB-dependent receptor [Pelagihabitans pacificus]
MNKRFLCLCATAWLSTGLVAQTRQNDSLSVQELEEVVVSDSRFRLKRENSGKTVIKITSQELRQNQGKSIAEVINTKSGLEIAGSRGREGAIFGVFARGGRGRQVLIVIDGVRVSDPSSFSSEYDLRLLSSANVESVEIIKGAASTLYGTNAATAVINIVTRKTSKRKIALAVESSLGTDQTVDNQNYNISRVSNAVSMSGTLTDFSYLVGFSNTYTDGLSAIVTPGNERDPFSRVSTDIQFGYQITKSFQIRLYGNQTKLNNAFDESFGLVDAPYEFISRQHRVGLSSNYTYSKGTVVINAAFSDYDAENRSAFPDTFQSNNWVLDLYNKYNVNDRFYTIVGLNIIQDKADLEVTEQMTLVDPYANMVYVSDFGLNVNAGIRVNNHSEYGTHLVYNVNPSFSLKTDNGYVKVLGSYATSYITPNLTQLYGAFGANPDLEPEENRTIEGGLEYSVDKKLRVSTLYFSRKEENFITFDQNFISINAENTIDAQGVELETNWNPLKALTIAANYTFTERKGDNAIRIPKHKINTSLAYRISDRTNALVSYTLTGERSDSDFRSFPTIDVPLDSFSLVDVYLGHFLLADKLKLFLNVNNLFNQAYTEVLGFTTRGRNVRVGCSLSL